MKWFDDTAYDEKTGEGTIAFLDEERKWLAPGDEILLDYLGVWKPVVVADKENEDGEVAVYAPSAGEGVEDAGFVSSHLLARTTRLPKGFLIHPKFHLEHYSEQLCDREKNNGQNHPPPFTHTTDAKKILFVTMVILLHDDFLGQAIRHRPLKHRCVNDSLYALPLPSLVPSERSTDHGMWVKDLERCVGDLRHMKGLVYRFRAFGKLAEVVPAETIRWIGPEEAYQAILIEFQPYIARIPEFKSYNNHKEELPTTTTTTEISVMSDDADLGKKLDAFMQRLAEREAKEEEYRKQSEERAEQHRREMDELNKKVDRLTGAGTASMPPDQSKEFKADLKAVLQVQLDAPYDVIFTTEVVTKAVAGKWAAKTDHLGFLQIDDKKNIRTNFRDIVYAALMELWYAKEIQRLKAENPSPEAGQSKVNDWFWSVLKNPVHCV